MHKNTHWSTIYNTPKLETTKMANNYKVNIQLNTMIVRKMKKINYTQYPRGISQT